METESQRLYKTNKSRFIVLCVLAAIIIIITLFNVFKKNDISGSAAVGSAIASGSYGSVIEKNGIRMYVDADGVTSTQMVSGGITFLNEEYTDAKGAHSVWIGIDNTDDTFHESCVLRAQIITPNEKEEYQSLFNCIDDKNKKDFSESQPLIYRVWIEAEDGRVIKIYSTRVSMFIEAGDDCDIDSRAYSIEEGNDESLELFVKNINSGEVSGRFFSVYIRHHNDAIVFVNNGQ